MKKISDVFAASRHAVKRALNPPEQGIRHRLGLKNRPQSPVNVSGDQRTSNHGPAPQIAVVPQKQSTSAPKFKYAQKAVPVKTEFSSKFSEAYPQVRAVSELGLMVEGPDGKIRRFPFDFGTKFEYGSPFEQMGRSIARQLGYIYDADRKHVIETLGEYRFDAAAKTVSFEVKGQATGSITDDAAIYDLGSGKWMLPQREFRGCTQACEEMLLAEGKTAEEVLQQTAKKMELIGKQEDGRSEDEYVKSLESRSSRKTVRFHAIDPADPKCLDKLMEALEIHGPCIFSSDGHARILDRMEKTADGQLILDVRDPFSGSALRIAMHDEFAREPNPLTARRWDAVFLQRRETSDPH